MKFNKLDLNLLVALDILLKEKSVSRAAELLHLSPSALSNSLSRLREYFDDELLVQIGRKMELTPRAQTLQESVRDVLLRIDSTIAAQPVFAPDRSDRTFRIFVSDYAQMVLGPAMLTLAAKARATVRFELLPQATVPHKNLARGEADLLIIPAAFTSPDHPRETLYSEDYVCMVWRDSKLAQEELTFERYFQAEHVVMKPLDERGEAFEEWFLKRYGVPRRIAVSTYSFVTLPALVVGTEYVATVQTRIARRLARAWPLEVRPAPVPFDRMEESMQWHKFHTNDPGLAWLRGLFAEAAKHIDDI